jgi:hypothetical protein
MVCGTNRTNNTLSLDLRFWVKSATYNELAAGAVECPWCEVLRLAVAKGAGVGASAEVLARIGHVDWGLDPFRPVFYSDGRTVKLEIFCTKGD